MQAPIEPHVLGECELPLLWRRQADRGVTVRWRRPAPAVDEVMSEARQQACGVGPDACGAFGVGTHAIVKPRLTRLET